MLEHLIKLGYDINILSQVRRNDEDSTGRKLPKGRDFYIFYTYTLTKNEKEIENEWPGFYNYEDMFADIKKKLKLK